MGRFFSHAGRIIHNSLPSESAKVLKAPRTHHPWCVIPGSAQRSKKSLRSVGGYPSVRQPEGGHIGPPLQKINYLFDRSLV